MDKARELRRGASRSSPAKQRQLKASGSLNGYNNLEFSEKSKKERIRSVRVSWRASPSNDDSEMGGGVSEGEEELRMPNASNDRRFKLNGKAFDDGGHVDPLSVPRKLRSAMSKRNRESLSPPMPDARKHHHAFNEAELPNINGIKRSKNNPNLGGFDRSSKQPTSITKEEEEVAEALYCLARIFPDDKPDKCDGENAMAKEEALPLVETTETSLPPSEVAKEEIRKTACASTETGALANPSCQDESHKASIEVEAMTKATIPDQSTFSGSQRFDLELNSPAQVDVQGIDSLTENEHPEKTQLSGAVSLSLPNQILTESSLRTGLLQTMQPEILSVRKLEETGKSQEAAQPIIEDSKTSAQLAFVEDIRQGIANGLSDSHGNLTWSSSSRGAAWPDTTACATTPVSTSNDVLPIKLPPVPVKITQSWKRCATHMHICQLIHCYRSTEQKSRCSLPENQLKSKEGTRLGVIGAANSTVLKNGFNNILPAGANSLVSERNLSNEAIMLQDHRFLQDQQASTASMVYSKKKKSCDFLSLSSAPESNNTGNGLESSAQLQVPYLHPLVQHPVIPFSLPNARYSSPYPDQLAAAATQQVQLQLPQYMSSPYYGPQAGHGGGSSKHHHHHQQQQQQMWAAQMAHYRPTSFPPSSQAPKWQNSRHDSSAIPPSSPSLELLGAKYSQSAQQLFAFPFSSASRPKRQLQQIHPSGGYEEATGGGVFRSDGTPPVQLLCNAQRI